MNRFFCGEPRLWSADFQQDNYIIKNKNLVSKLIFRIRTKQEKSHAPSHVMANALCFA